MIEKTTLPPKHQHVYMLTNDYLTRLLVMLCILNCFICACSLQQRMRVCACSLQQRLLVCVCSVQQRLLVCACSLQQRMLVCVCSVQQWLLVFSSSSTLMVGVN